MLKIFKILVFIRNSYWINVQRVGEGSLTYYGLVIYDGVLPNTHNTKDRYVVLVHPAECNLRFTINQLKFTENIKAYFLKSLTVFVIKKYLVN